MLAGGQMLSSGVPHVSLGATQCDIICSTEAHTRRCAVKNEQVPMVVTLLLCCRFPLEGGTGAIWKAVSRLLPEEKQASL
jgi:hypothetical protein